MTVEATDPTTLESLGETVSRLAAIVFDPDEEPDEALIAFVDEAIAARRAHRGPGAGEGRGRPWRSTRRQAARSPGGEILPIMQDLGAGATGCAVDPAAIAKAARLLDRAVATKPDLLVVNRFGRLESEGAGMLAEIGQAFAEGVAMIVCVPRRYCEAWNAFAAGLDAQLPARREAIEAWWRAIAPVAAGAL